MSKLQYLIKRFKEHREQNIYLGIYNCIKPIIEKECYKYHGQNYYKDLRQAAYEGLLIALDRIDLTYADDSSICAYIQKWVKGEVMKEIKKNYETYEDVDKVIEENNLMYEELRQQLTDKENNINFFRLVYKLRPDQFDMMVYHWQGYTFNEIGEKLGATGNAIKMRYHKVLKDLKNKLKVEHEAD